MKKWSIEWLKASTTEQLKNALDQAEGNCVYCGDTRKNSPKYFRWAKRADAVRQELELRP